MGLIKFSGLVTGIWGHLNGSVFTRNRSGAIIKNKETPTNPQSPGQNRNRSSLSYLSRKWRILLDHQRVEWNELAELITLHNYWGDSYSPSGFNLFCRLNQNLKVTGCDYIFDAPAQVPVPVLSGVRCDPIHAGADSILFVFPSQTTDTDIIHLIYASPGISQGKYYNKSNFKIIGTIPPGTANLFESYPAYVSVFPVPRSGQKIFFKLRGISKTTGFDNWASGFANIVYTSASGIGHDMIGSTLIVY